MSLAGCIIVETKLPVMGAAQVLVSTTCMISQLPIKNTLGKGKASVLELRLPKLTTYPHILKAS